MNNKVNNIKEQRKTLTYSTKEISCITNVPEKDIVAYEANLKTATKHTVEKIAISTGTKVNDWVGEDYFKQSKYIKNTSNKGKESVSGKKDNNDLLLTFFKAMFKADNVMDTLYSALIDMKEIEMNKGQLVVLSNFSEELIKSISTIKLKKVLELRGYTKNNDSDTDNLIHEKTNRLIDEREGSPKRESSLERITFYGLLHELRHLFIDTDIVDVIIEALININCIDLNGCHSEKANLLLNTIISNKVKNLMTKKDEISLKSY